MICAAGRQDDDWSADYRLFARDRWHADDLFVPVVRGVLQRLPDDAPLVAALDDTSLRKTGRKIPGVGYRRDPMSPPFHVNFVPGQRFVQLSALVHDNATPAPARGVPVRFRHAPPVPKPKADADEVAKNAYHEQGRQNNLSTRGRDLIEELRDELDRRHDARRRKLIVAGDGSYTNQTVLRGLPERTAFIGRVRKDAQLHYPPPGAPASRVGRRRRYGDGAPTPEELRKDERVAWREVEAYASGSVRAFRVKELRPVLWRKAGADLPLRLVVVAPTPYRLRRGGKLLYRQPAFLLSTDLESPLEKLLQYYLWRWDIEVNHRDEKQLIGVGQAQVRSPRSADRQPALAVASYAYLLLAALRVYGVNERGPSVAVPKWQRKMTLPRVSTQKLLRELRSEIWSHAIERLERDRMDRLASNSADFVNAPPADTKRQKPEFPLEAAALFARTG